MTALLCFVSFVGILALAFHGHWYRGAYVALAILTIVIGAISVSLTGAPTSDDPAVQAGAAFINTYALPFAQWAFVTGFAAILGACVYRRH